MDGGGLTGIGNQIITPGPGRRVGKGWDQPGRRLVVCKITPFIIHGNQKSLLNDDEEQAPLFVILLLVVPNDDYDDSDTDDDDGQKWRFTPN